MKDAYAHLDMSSRSPVADLRVTMESAGVMRGLVVETWSGSDRVMLEEFLFRPVAHFRLALCFRAATGNRIGYLSHDAVLALRVRSSELLDADKVISGVLEHGKWLLPHADTGIGSLATKLMAISAKHPSLRIYLPHLGWPKRVIDDDPEWHGSIKRLAELPNILVGVSGLSYFSRQPFPHVDVKALALQFIATFPSTAIVVGSDYPLLEKEHYAGYLKLGCDWVKSIYPEWRNDDALLP
jgi:hypothetical protein